jgi:hypothetical protein
MMETIDISSAGSGFAGVVTGAAVVFAVMRERVNSHHRRLAIIDTHIKEIMERKHCGPCDRELNEQKAEIRRMEKEVEARALERRTNQETLLLERHKEVIRRIELVEAANTRAAAAVEDCLAEVIRDLKNR